MSPNGGGSDKDLSLTITKALEIQGVLSKSPHTCGETVRYYRKEISYISQVELAVACKVSESTMRRLETNKIKESDIDIIIDECKVYVTEEVYCAYKRPIWAEEKHIERSKRCRSENRNTLYKRLQHVFKIQNRR